MKITTAVIPVAGKGTRFLPATKSVPKEMIPILHKPMIQYVVEEAVDSGIERIVFVTSTGKEAIKNYFSPSSELEDFLEKNNKTKELELCKKIGNMVEVEYAVQDEQLGLGHAIACAEDLVKDQNFSVLLGDDLIIGGTPVTKQLIDVSTRHGGAPAIGVMEVPRADCNKYGIIDGEALKDEPTTLKILDMVEKPDPKNAPSNLATPGRYLLTPEIFDCLRNIKKGSGGEYQLTDAISMLAKSRPFYAHIFENDRYDTGNVQGWLRATIEFALKDPNLHESTLKIIKAVNQQYKD
jgi:UTP--glucose-1-phosphate uridylyltransferase